MLCGTAAHEVECMRGSASAGALQTRFRHTLNRPEHASQTVAVSPCHIICVRCGAAITP